MADRSQELHAINQILNSGATEVMIDGLRTRYDLEQLRLRKRELEAENDASAGRRRPVVSKVLLNFS